MKSIQDKTDYANQIREIADEFLGYLSERFPENVVFYTDRIEETVMTLLDVEKPKVMVYGIYNSGKSTMINALMRQEVAEMADRPMTDRISEFDHGDYILVDSPGIDAPIQHEEVTDQFLNKCHIILFVISSKGGFEAKYNYEKMAELINRDTPFIIVLNDRGVQIKNEWSPAEKERRRAKYEQELKLIQYKIIDNLKRVTGNKNITDKYEVYVLNAKKALRGIQQNKEKLYESSHIQALDQRIVQLVHDGSALDVFRQPLMNLRICLDEVEKDIAGKMQESDSGNFAEKIEILRKKQENLKDEMRILTKQAVNSRVEEVALLYASNDAEATEQIQFDIVQDVEDKYRAKLREVLTYIQRSFGELEDVGYMADDMSDSFTADLKTMDYSSRNMGHKEMVYEEPDPCMPEKKNFLDGIFEMFKSQKKREQEKQERLERYAELLNERNQNLVNEKLRIRQEARKAASTDLYQVQNQLIAELDREINEKFSEIVGRVQEYECENQELLQEGRRQLEELTAIRKRLEALEHEIM